MNVEVVQIWTALHDSHGAEKAAGERKRGPPTGAGVCGCDCVHVEGG